ncbi:MAG: hypothetical protein M3176_00205 [Chloroflexota bacterium]|nr:hypothetical protein [Chloroflexota bacterium]
MGKHIEGTSHTGQMGAAWRGDLRPLWGIVIAFFGLIAAAALIIEIASGFIAWLLFAGALVIAWLLAVAILVPWSASYDVPKADDNETEVRRRVSES